MPLFSDQCGRSVSIDHAPIRIVSLVPSQSELLFDLGLHERVIGITKFCIHPEKWFRTKIRVGGTKTVNTAIIDQLQPDLIIANKEENVKEQVEELATRYPVWVSDVNNLDDALEMITAIGNITSTIDKAADIIEAIRAGFDALSKDPRPKIQGPKKEIQKEEKEKAKKLPFRSSSNTGCYLIWKEPYITVGGDTFINNMLQYAGLSNSFAHLSRYPELTIPDLQSANPELLLLSSEPFPFRQKHIDELKQELPNTKIVLVDGEMFSWYGSRLLKAPEYFAELRKQISKL